MDRVIIIGGGPVGFALSVALARYKVKSVVIEKRLEPTPVNESRAIVWMPKGIEFLKWLGMLEEFEKNALKRTVHQFTRRGQKLIDLDLSMAKSEFGYSLNLPQHYSEKLLEEEAKRNPDLVTIMRGYEILDIEQNSTHITATIQHTGTQETETISGKFVVGCDGAKSRVREIAGIELLWNDYGTYSAVADIEAHIPAQDAATSWIDLNPQRPVGLFAFHPDKWRVTYRVNSNETRDEAATHAFAKAIIRKHLPFIRDYSILWVSCFRLGQGQSKSYHNNRIILAGDAAHPMGPSAGAGMMVGMLGVWRLAFRLRNILHASDAAIIAGVLNAYEHDQRKGSETIQKTNAATFAQIALSQPWKGWIRNNVLRLLSLLPFVKRKIVTADTLTDQEVYYEPF